MEWINVKDRLPFEGDFDELKWPNVIDTFIVYFDDQEDPSVGFADYMRSKNKENSGWYYPDGAKHEYWADKITHWMPLPDPPNSVKGES